jgi:hypothetical protein
LKVSIIVSDDDGNNYHGEVDLTASSKAPQKRTKHIPPSKSTTKTPVNLSTPIRPFVKQHARKMSGSQKFALLVAYMTKGDSHQEVQMTDVEKQWNKMKSLLGRKLNRAHSTRAKENGWVNSPKHGVYVILPGWKDIFNA